MKIVIFIINIPVFLYRILHIIVWIILKMHLPRRFYMSKGIGKHNVTQMRFDGILSVFVPVICNESYRMKIVKNPRMRVFKKKDNSIPIYSGYSNKGLDFII